MPHVLGPALVSPREWAWCLACGRAAEVLGASMDLTHPIIRCAPQAGDTSYRGCGRQPGTRDQGEARTLAWRRHEARIARAHQAGKHAPPGLRTCHLCAPSLIHAAHVRARELAVGCELCAGVHQAMLSVWEGERV